MRDGLCTTNGAKTGPKFHKWFGILYFAPSPPHPLGPPVSLHQRLLAGGQAFRLASRKAIACSSRESRSNLTISYPSCFPDCFPRHRGLGPVS